MVIRFEDANVSGAYDIRGGDEVRSTQRNVTGDLEGKVTPVKPDVLEKQNAYGRQSDVCVP